MKKYRRTSPERLVEIEEKSQAMTEGFRSLVDRTATIGKTSPEYIQFKRDAGRLYNKISRANDFVTLISNIKRARTEVKERTLIKLFGYLGLVESIGAAMVDFALIILILNNRTFHIESTKTVPPIRHATSVKDFEDENISLGAKLGFLEQNSLGFFARMIKRTLRNRIAHLKFEIDDDGNVFYYKGKRKKNIDIDFQIRELWNTISAFRIFLSESGMFKFMKKATLKE